MSAEDVNVLSGALKDLLSGELKVGLGMVNIGKALKRQSKNKEWVTGGLKRWIEENEEAIPLIVTALGETGLEKMKAWLERR